MAVSLPQVRRIALSLPGVVEGVCHDTAAFYIRNRLMLRLRDYDENLVVRCPIALRDELIDGEPDIFFLTDHYRNFPAVLVSLINVSETRLKKIITEAWQRLASKRQIAAFSQTSGSSDSSERKPRRAT